MESEKSARSVGDTKQYSRGLKERKDFTVHPLDSHNLKELKQIPRQNFIHVSLSIIYS